MLFPVLIHSLVYGNHYKLSSFGFGSLEPMHLFFYPQNIAFEDEILDLHSSEILNGKVKVELTLFLFAFWL